MGQRRRSRAQWRRLVEGWTGSGLTWAREHEICVIAMPPIRRYFEEYVREEFMILYSNIKHYYLSRGVAFLGNPVDHMYEMELFFNSEYHLNSEGIERRIKQVVADIDPGPRKHCSSFFKNVR